MGGTTLHEHTHRTRRIAGRGRDLPAAKHSTETARVFRKYKFLSRTTSTDLRDLAMLKASFLVVGLVTGAAMCAPGAAAMTPAGELIENSATVRFAMDGLNRTVISNTVTTRVAELVSFEVSVATPMLGGVQAGERHTHTVDITNTGNGAECFAVSQMHAADVRAPVELAALHVDSDGDGEFNAARDAALGIGACGPQIAPGQRMRVFAIGRMPEETSATQAELALWVAPSEGGPGYGAVIPGRGDNGGDMVIGFDASRSSARMWTQASRLVVSLSKLQLVSGHNQVNAVTGDVITYSLLLKATGEGMVKGALVSDPLPAGLRYVAGSLSLDGVVLSDDADADAGQSSSGVVAVRLPDAAAPFERTITFQAVVRPQSS